VTKQVRDRLVRIYQQVPEPKIVVAVGTCATSGGVFTGLYNVMGGIDQAIKVDAYIPGCPASPQAIIDGFAKLIKSLETTGKPPAPETLAAEMPPGAAAEMPPGAAAAEEQK
jgi:Ni,Fe-hydrogenase III small subunit